MTAVTECPETIVAAMSLSYTWGKQGDRGTEMIRILIADDQTLMREGLQTILSIQDDMEIVGEAKDGEEALQLAAELKPQVVLMDIRMPRMDGLKCTRRIKRLLPDTVLLILTTFAEDEYIVEALASGATGFLLKIFPERSWRKPFGMRPKGNFCFLRPLPRNWLNASKRSMFPPKLLLAL